MLGMLVWLVHLFALGAIAVAGILLVAALLLYEHAIVSPTNLSRINAAFFSMNGVISIVFFVAVAGDVLTRSAFLTRSVHLASQLR